MATNASTRLLTVEEFLEIDFGPEAKVELDNGTIRMMAGARARHNRIQSNMIVAFATRLRGSGCSAYGSDTGVRSHEMSLRYPDVSIFCGRDGPAYDDMRWFDDPRVIVEILSQSTALHDQSIKLREYQAIPTVESIIFVDPEEETIDVRHRTDSWARWVVTAVEQLEIPALGLVVPATEVFARD